jgi:hypothetical protein
MGRTLELRTLLLSAVRALSCDSPQAIDLSGRGHFSCCPFGLSVSGGGGHSPPLGAVRPPVRRREEEQFTLESRALESETQQTACGRARGF